VVGRVVVSRWSEARLKNAVGENQLERPSSSQVFKGY
jgi:hypothetical protein